MSPLAVVSHLALIMLVDDDILKCNPVHQGSLHFLMAMKIHICTASEVLKLTTGTDYQTHKTTCHVAQVGRHLGSFVASMREQI